MTILNLRRFLVVSFFLSTGMLRSAAQSQPPSCALSCTSSAASRAGCNIYKVACFCSNPQFSSTAESCIQETCAGSEIQDATNFVEDLCTVGSVRTTSSSNSPYATAAVAHNAAAASLKSNMALLGGALGALQVVAALT